MLYACKYADMGPFAGLFCFFRADRHDFAMPQAPLGYAIAVRLREKRKGSKQPKRSRRGAGAFQMGADLDLVTHLLLFI